MSASKEQQLWEACTSGDLDLVKSLANDPAVNVNWVGPERSDTPLHRACRFGHVEVVKVLLKLPKINVNAENAGKATPFYIACQNGHKEEVSLLLADTRIDVNKPMDGGFTPFHRVCENGHKEVVSLLLASIFKDLLLLFLLLPSFFPRSHPSTESRCRVQWQQARSLPITHLH